MTAQVVVIPFDLFGSAGAGDGAQLLADALREMLADNRRERRPSRCRAYQDRVKISELKLETLSAYESWRQRAKKQARTALGENGFLLWLGGNHLSVLPLLEQLGAMPGSMVVQFDAHLDVYNLSDCTTELSHGNFLLHAEQPLPPIVHVGHRDLFLPHQHVAEHFRTTISAEDLAVEADAAVRRLGREVAKARQVWIDIDCDVFDPACFPAVSHPMPFGLNPALLLRLIQAVWSDRVAGVSISEFEPGRDRNDRSLGMLVWLLEYLLMKRFER
jgi:arginase family enzyme